MKKILNQQDMRDLNLNSVLRLIRHAGPITRRQIEAALDLSWGAVSGATATLLQGGYIKEVKAPDVAGAGRTPVALVINSEDHFILGLDINRSGLSGVVVDQTGHVLLRTKAEATALTKDEWIGEISALTERLLHFAGKRSVLAIGIAMQGAVDAQRGISAVFPAEGWQNVPLADILSKRFGLPVFLEHDPDCILYAASADRELQDAVLLRVDKGTGMAVMLDGKIFKRFGAFELGFTVQNGHTLDDRITTRGIATAAGCPFSEAVAAAKAGDPHKLALFDALADDLATAMINVAQLLNVKEFLLCGNMMSCKELFRERLIAAAGDLSIDETDVGLAAVGAALLAAARHKIRFE
ncbi:MAG: ROK family transcriptional regulator [Clostridia bacterium]|nr:ROK family transcriptional regulator [Clostridia bacterium]